jgi:LysM repeat protein
MMGCSAVRARFRLLSMLAALVLCPLFCVGSARADKTYVVRRYDTLTGIAREHGVSLGDLAARNGLGRNAKVKVGQRLLIPESADHVETSILPAKIREAIADANVKPGQWKYLVVHHSGTEIGSVQGMDRYHREQRHMENGLAYHFVIGNGNGMPDGAVAAGNRWRNQIDGGHLASESLNHISLGICLVGNFEKEGPTEKQLRSLKALLRALMDRCDLPASAVRTHQQINPIYTRCPGRNFPSKTITKDLSARR